MFAGYIFYIRIKSILKYDIFQKNPLNGLENGIELDVVKEERRSRSLSGSPNAYLKSKTITAFMRTELSYNERSFHKNQCCEKTLRKFRRAISTPNLNEVYSERNFKSITEVRMKRNDILMKVV